MTRFCPGITVVILVSSLNFGLIACTSFSPPPLEETALQPPTVQVSDLDEQLRNAINTYRGQALEYAPDFKPH